MDVRTYRLNQAQQRTEALEASSAQAIEALQQDLAREQEAVKGACVSLSCKVVQSAAFAVDRCSHGYATPRLTAPQILLLLPPTLGDADLTAREAVLRQERDKAANEASALVAALTKNSALDQERRALENK